MTLELIVNPDSGQTDVYKIARAVYAETGAATLAAVEAMCSMISNIANKFNRAHVDVAADDTIFSALNPDSARYVRLQDAPTSRGFQMCLRVVRRMLTGALHDTVYGAVRFHHADTLPDWATARGYIADVDGLLFYL